jgi:hypothetical protein
MKNKAIRAYLALAALSAVVSVFGAVWKWT